MSDAENRPANGSENGSDQVIVRRRKPTRRHRRNRMVRRCCAGILLVVSVVALSSLALNYLSPSFFRPQAKHVKVEVPESTLDQLKAESTASPRAARPVYPYSVVPGGVEDVKELKWVAEHDPVVAAHYAGFDYAHAQVVRLTLARTAYVSYRIGSRIYWTHHRLALRKGEKLITDGRMTARTRCANRVEETPQQEAAAPVEPPPQKFDEPVRNGEGTAMQAPPVPFESALLTRPQIPGLDAARPLSLYDPFVGGGWTPIAAPPLPIPSELCAPAKKKGTGEIEIEADGVGKKKKTGACGGSGGVIPEPSTWLLFASGLAAIYWQARRKLVRG
ncbi:MAG TPA: PEP-CTERM sorting domain-containing protein [Candidatus Binatia bacterium]|nr:PEP-CTERM sorting domain-containing protein [Candidatus Binatia bacterium]